MSTRLTKTIREAIAHNVVEASKYPELIKNLTVKMHKILHLEAEKALFNTNDTNVITDYITEAKRISALASKLNATCSGLLSTSLLAKVSHVVLRIDGQNFGVVHLKQLNEGSGQLEPLMFYGKPTIMLSTHSNKLAAEYMALRDEREALENKRDDLRQVTLTALSKITTTKKLKEEWPDGMQYLPNIVQRTGLPAIPIANLQALIAESKA